jgi:hypothetical protein
MPIERLCGCFCGVDNSRHGGKPLSPRIRTRIAIAAAGYLLLGAGTASAATEFKIDATCAGDTINGTLSYSGGTKGETYSLELLYRPRKGTDWKSTGRGATFTSDGHPGTYSYSYDISAFDAKLYRLDVTGEHAWSRTIPAASCAPGRQVPESPLAILLPLSLLGTSGMLLFRRRRTL